jgi:DNA-binding transcriptional LysR family regulator
VDVHQLRCFLAVAEERHFGRGAERLHLTTSPVSRAVRELEREVGAPLFVRGHHHATLTAAGERLAQRAAPLVAGFDELLPELRSMVAAAQQVVRIGSSHLTPPEVVDAVAECATKAFPERDVVVELRSGPDLFSLLTSGELDLMVDYLPLGRAGVRSYSLRSYHMGVAMRVDDALAARDSLTIADIADRTIQLPAYQPAPPAVLRLRRQLEDRGARHVQLFPAPDIIALSEHVRRTGDLSLAFVNVRTGANRVFEDPAFVVVPAVDGPDLDLGVAWHADREAAEPVSTLLAEVLQRWPGARPVD